MRPSSSLPNHRVPSTQIGPAGVGIRGGDGVGVRGLRTGARATGSIGPIESSAYSRVSSSIHIGCSGALSPPATVVHSATRPSSTRPTRSSARVPRHVRVIPGDPGQVVPAGRESGMREEFAAGDHSATPDPSGGDARRSRGRAPLIRRASRGSASSRTRLPRQSAEPHALIGGRERDRLRIRASAPRRAGRPSRRTAEPRRRSWSTLLRRTRARASARSRARGSTSATEPSEAAPPHGAAAGLHAATLSPHQISSPTNRAPSIRGVAAVTRAAVSGEGQEPNACVSVMPSTVLRRSPARSRGGLRAPSLSAAMRPLRSLGRTTRRLRERAVPHRFVVFFTVDAGRAGAAPAPVPGSARTAVSVASGST